jgi:histidinol-phosphate phosphatase family protein
MDAYVLKPDDFSFLEGADDAIAKLSKIFGVIVVVTNQQGIGKGLMTEADLEQIHQKMVATIEVAGGRIDKIYHCPALQEENNICRKPLPGMALRARKDFPSIHFKRSVMVGDTISDMRFGKRLGMITVFIGDDRKAISENHKLIDFSFNSLISMADHIARF